MFIKTESWILIPKKKRKFSVLFHFLGWHCLQVGVHFDLIMINFELHLPFCFIRIGFDDEYETCIQTYESTKKG